MSFGVPNALNTLKNTLDALKPFKNTSTSALFSVLPLSPPTGGAAFRGTEAKRGGLGYPRNQVGESCTRDQEALKAVAETFSCAVLMSRHA